MAAEVNILVGLEVTGLGGREDTRFNRFTSGTTPTEIVRGKPVIGNTAATLNLGDIAAGSGYILYLEAIIGNLYVKLGVTTGTPAAADSRGFL